MLFIPTKPVSSFIEVDGTLEVERNFLAYEETRSENKINTFCGMPDIPYFGFISPQDMYESDYCVENVPRQRINWRCMQTLSALLLNSVL